MRAVPLLDLRVTHPFYDDLRCGDFAVAPTRATDALMRRLRLTCKTRNDCVSLFAGLDNEGVPLAAAAAPLTLDFFLRPRNDAFALFTDLTPIVAQTAPLFTNAGLPAADPLNLRLTSRTERGTETLTVRTPATAETFVLAGRPLPGTIAQFEVETAGFAGAVKGLDPAANSVVVDTSAAASGTRFELSYPVAAARPHDVFAELELALDRALLLAPAAGPRAFLVPLAARSARWCVYLVTDYMGDVSTLRIVDATPGGAPRRVTFADAGRVDLSQGSDRADAIGQDLVRRNPGRRILRFLSDAPVGCREMPLRNLELRMADTRLIAALANPAPGNFTALTTAPPPAAPETVLYDVLTLIAN
ncbi:MAG TPA: hypothetical protein VHS58_15580 [Acetobacteraceae bacterium]|nr:hypothetical protein [Acetobacteraceae bacterium]